MLRILHNTKFDFIRRWKQAAGVVIALIIPAVALILINGFNWSIEFTGGTRIQLEFTNAADVGAVRSELALPAHRAQPAEVATREGPGKLHSSVHDRR